MLGTGSDLFIPLLSELTAAVLLFASLPEAVWNALRRTLLPETLVGEKTRLKLRRAAGHCATEAAQAFYKLYLAMLSGAGEVVQQETKTCASYSTGRATGCARAACCAHSAGRRTT